MGRVRSLAGHRRAREQYRAALRLSIDNDLAVFGTAAARPGAPERARELEFVEAELAKQPHLGEGVTAFFGHAVHTLEALKFTRPCKSCSTAAGPVATWSTMTQQLLAMGRFPEGAARRASHRSLSHAARVSGSIAPTSAGMNDDDGQIEALRQRCQSGGAGHARTGRGLDRAGGSKRPANY